MKQRFETKFAIATSYYGSLQKELNEEDTNIDIASSGDHKSVANWWLKAPASNF